MGFFNELLTGLVKVGGTLIGVASHYVLKFKEKVKETVYTLQSQITGVKEEIKQTKSVNDEIIDLEKKRQRDGGLNSNDSHRLNELYSERSLLREAVEAKKEADLAKDIAENESSFDSLLVDDVNLHILQFHVGQNVLGKKCARCNKPMTLQWQREHVVKYISQFYWGCTGFYDSSCRATQSITQNEFNLITKVDRAEFSISNEILTRIVESPVAKNTIRKRISEIKNMENEAYLCPMHGEPMILREKKNPNGGLMDQYFLACPRYYDAGCKQIMKIKSAGQLAAILETKTGTGIL